MMKKPRSQFYLRWFFFLIFSLLLGSATGVLAQGDDEPAGPSAVVEEGQGADVENEPAAENSDAPAGSAATEIESLNLLSILLEGGWFFLTVLGLMSLMVVTFTVERFLALRRDRVMPDALITDLGKLGSAGDGFDPRQAYRLCQQYPSAASTVIRAMLLKVGRPLSEVQHTIQEASEREADRIYANVRWLTLAVAVAPLVGLLGTVWGMILAFYETTQLSPDQSKAEQLAHGIWTALVTTLCGLVIAITAAIFAHYFEGRITMLFHKIDELLFNLLPQIERYEGRVRFSRQSGENEIVDQAGNQDSAQNNRGESPVEPPPPPVQTRPTSSPK